MRLTPAHSSCTNILYNSKEVLPVIQKKLNVSEARKQFSRLVGGVGKRQISVAITQHGKERAALIGMDEYRELVEKARAFDDSKTAIRPFTLKGSLRLRCPAKDLVAEMQKIRNSWNESMKRSTDALIRKLARE
jgi:prevent-host-death family protein